MRIEVHMYKGLCTHRWALVPTVRMALPQWALFGCLFQMFYTYLKEPNSHLLFSEHRERKVTVYSDINHAL